MRDGIDESRQSGRSYWLREEGGGCGGGAAMISRSDGERLSRLIGAAAFLECSAYTQKGLKEVFEKVAETAKRPRKKCSGDPCAII